MITINTGTGAIDGVDLQFTSPDIYSIGLFYGGRSEYLGLYQADSLSHQRTVNCQGGACLDAREPAVLALVATGLGMIGLLARREGRKAPQWQTEQ
jgi:hypothetical protein